MWPRMASNSWHSLASASGMLGLQKCTTMMPGYKLLWSFRGRRSLSFLRGMNGFHEFLSPCLFWDRFQHFFPKPAWTVILLLIFHHALPTFYFFFILVLCKLKTSIYVYHQEFSSFAAKLSIIKYILLFCWVFFFSIGVWTQEPHAFWAGLLPPDPCMPQALLLC
jgi:hypothetical protein